MSFEENYPILRVDLTAIAEEFDTPLYVYDADTIRRQYERLN